MKKFLFILLFASASLWAADGHSISVSYGVMNAYSWSAAFGKAASKPAASIFGVEEPDEKVGRLSASSFNIAYGFELTDLFEVGGILSYTYIADGHDIHTITVMPKGKFNWINKTDYRFYSQIALGAMFFLGSDQKGSSSLEINDDTAFMFHASLLGFEFGDDISFFCELGVGQAGMFAGGVKFKL